MESVNIFNYYQLPCCHEINALAVIGSYTTRKLQASRRNCWAGLELGNYDFFK